MVVSRNIRIKFSPKSEGETKKSTLTRFAVDESDANHVPKKKWEKSIIWVGKSQILSPAS